MSLRRRWLLLLASLFLCAGSVVDAAGQTLRFDEVGRIEGRADLIRAQGQYLYTATEKTFSVFDVSNPKSPNRVGEYKFPDNILGFRASGSFVYVAANLYGLGILEIAESGMPRLRGNYKTPGSAKNVAASGSTVVIADQVAGVDFIDVSDPAKPMSIGSLYLDGFASDVAAAGSLAYAVDRPNGFYTADLSKPKSEEPLSALRSSLSINGGMQLELVTDASGHAVTAIRSLGQLLLYDVSNPAKPVERMPFHTPGRPQRITVQGTTVYVADGPEGLQAIDVSNASQPRIIGSYKTAAPAIDVAASQTLVFVAVRGGGVLVLRRVND